MFITRNRTLRRGGAAAVVASATLVLGGCGDTAGPETGTDVEDIQEEGAAGVDAEIFGDPQSFAGQQVTVSAEISEIIGPNAFTIADENAEPLLVVYDGRPSVNMDTPVQVTGTVIKTFALPEAEGFAGADFEDEPFVGYNGEPYIQASSLDTTVTPAQNGE